MTTTAEHLLDEFLQTHHIGSVDDDPDNPQGPTPPVLIPPDPDAELEDD